MDSGIPNTSLYIPPLQCNITDARFIIQMQYNDESMDVLNRIQVTPRSNVHAAHNGTPVEHEGMLFASN